MNFEFLVLGGYGQFVWPAFIFTFVCFVVLYKTTKKELTKQEKMFLNKYGELHSTKIKSIEEKKITKEALSGSSI